MTAERQPPQSHLPHVSADISEDPIVLGLKQLYDSVLEEAIPDDFMGFLSQIDAACEQKTSKNQSTGRTSSDAPVSSNVTRQGTGQ